MPTTSNAAEPSAAATAGRWAEPGRVFVQPNVLTILGTYKCTAACENCCFGSNPFITKRLGLPDILSFISEGARTGSCKMVVFSGGECFLLRDDLVAAVAHATRLGLATRCVTNGYWAKRMEHGRRRLQALRDAGLTELNISTGDYHQRFVDQQTVINAACLSVELMKSTLIVVESQKERRVSAAALGADPRIQRLLAEHGDRFQLIESPWMPMSLDVTIEQDPAFMLNRHNVHRRSGMHLRAHDRCAHPGPRHRLLLWPDTREDSGDERLVARRLIRPADRRGFPGLHENMAVRRRPRTHPGVGGKQEQSNTMGKSLLPPLPRLPCPVQ